MLTGWTKCRCVLYASLSLQFTSTNRDMCRVLSLKPWCAPALLCFKCNLGFCGCAMTFGLPNLDCPLELFVKCTNQSNINLTFVLTMRFMLKETQCVKSRTLQTSEVYSTGKFKIKHKCLLFP